MNSAVDSTPPNIRHLIAWLVSGFLLLAFIYLYQKFESCPIAISGLLSCNLTPAWTALLFSVVSAFLAIFKPSNNKLAKVVTITFLVVAVLYVTLIALSDVVYSLGNSWTTESLLDVGLLSLGLITLIFRNRPWPVFTGILTAIVVIWIGFIYLLLLG